MNFFEIRRMESNLDLMELLVSQLMIVGRSEPKHILPKWVVVVGNGHESHGRIHKKNPLLTNKSYLLKTLFFFIAHLTHPTRVPRTCRKSPWRKVPEKWLVENARVETWMIGSWICNYTTVFIGDFDEKISNIQLFFCYQNPIIQFLEYYTVDLIHPSMQSSPPWSRSLQYYYTFLDLLQMLQNILPSGGLLVIYHGTKEKINPKQIQGNQPFQLLILS